MPSSCRNANRTRSSRVRSRRHRCVPTRSLVAPAAPAASSLSQLQNSNTCNRLFPESTATTRSGLIHARRPRGKQAAPARGPRRPTSPSPCRFPCRRAAAGCCRTRRRPVGLARSTSRPYGQRNWPEAGAGVAHVADERAVGLEHDDAVVARRRRRRRSRRRSTIDCGRTNWPAPSPNLPNCRRNLPSGAKTWMRSLSPYSAT